MHPPFGGMFLGKLLYMGFTRPIPSGFSLLPSTVCPAGKIAHKNSGLQMQAAESIFY
jgi:hypothetical protein